MDLWTIAIVLMASLFCGIAACTHPVRRLVFQPHKIDLLPEFPKHFPGLQQFWLQTDQGKVEGWIMQDRATVPQRPGPAVLIAHGNRELIDFYLEHAVFYCNLGFVVLLGEYRGYGRSAGKPSRERIKSDFIRFYDKLAALPGVDAERIVFHGRSLGGAVLAELAHDREPAAIIIESAFSSIQAMAHGAPNFLLSDNYDTGSAMAAYDGPVLIMHGIRDRVVPVQHAHRLKKQISHARLLLGDFGHSDGPASAFDYWGSIQQFIEQTGVLGIKKADESSFLP
jgi:alpha-beta hydrolase superfamily lysophospholipase